VTVCHPVQANAVFATLPRAVTEKLQLDYPFHLWDEATGQVRWMASFDTTEEDVDGFVKRLGELA
jgi:threonine aldolase